MPPFIAVLCWIRSDLLIFLKGIWLGIDPRNWIYDPAWLRQCDTCVFPALCVYMDRMIYCNVNSDTGRVQYTRIRFHAVCRIRLSQALRVQLASSPQEGMQIIPDGFSCSMTSSAGPRVTAKTIVSQTTFLRPHTESWDNLQAGHDMRPLTLPSSDNTYVRPWRRPLYSASYSCPSRWKRPISAV